MNQYEHEVHWEKWCPTCKYYKESEFNPDSECYECMFDFKNEATSKPIKYVKK